MKTVSRSRVVAFALLLMVALVAGFYTTGGKNRGLQSSAIPTGNFICSVEGQKATLTNYTQLKSAVAGYTAQAESLKSTIGKSQDSIKSINSSIKKNQSAILSLKKDIKSLKGSREKSRLANLEKKLRESEKSLSVSKKQRDRLVKDIKPLSQKIENLNQSYQENVAKLQNYELCEKSLAGKVTLSNPNMLDEVTVVAEPYDSVGFYSFEVQHATFGGGREPLTAEEIVFDIEMSRDTDFDNWQISQDDNENSPTVFGDCTLSDTKKALTCLPNDPAIKFVVSKPGSYENTTRYNLRAVTRNTDTPGQIVIKNVQLKLSDTQTEIGGETAQKITKYEKGVPPTLVSNISTDIYWSPENENQKTITNHSITTGNLDITLDSVYYPINRIEANGRTENIYSENTIRDVFLMQGNTRMAMSCTPNTSLNQSAVPIIFGIWCVSSGDIVIPKGSTADMKLVIVFDTSSVVYTDYDIRTPQIIYSMRTHQYELWDYKASHRLFIANKNNAYWYARDWDYNTYIAKRVVECQKAGAKVADTLCTQKKPVVEQVMLQSFVIVSPSSQTVKTQESANYIVQMRNTSGKSLKDVTISPSRGQGCTLAPVEMQEMFISGELRVKPLYSGGATEFFDPNETIEFSCNQTYPYTGNFWEFSSFKGYSLSGDAVVWGQFSFMTIVEDTPLCSPGTPDSSNGETVGEISICREYTPL